MPENIWTYQIGGYQVCEKWLKDRKERRLELDDIRTYCHIVTALTRTIEIQKQLDAFYPDVEHNIVAVSGQAPAALPAQKPKRAPKKTGSRKRPTEK